MKHSAAHTLTEILVGIVVLAVLATLAVVSIQQARTSAASVQCISHLRILVMAHGSYRAEHQGRNPPYSVFYENHNFFGGVLLRRYYLPGPNYAWENGKPLPVPEVEKCPMVRVRPDLALQPDGTITYGMMPHHDTVNLNLHPTPSKIPVLFDAWGSAWQKTLPLRHLRFNGINAAFLDGHVETISQEKSDGRLYWQWWYTAVRSDSLTASDANLGKGDQVGSLTPP